MPLAVCSACVGGADRRAAVRTRNVDGFALRAADTVGATERTAAADAHAEVLACGHAPALTVEPGTATRSRPAACAARRDAW